MSDVNQGSKPRPAYQVRLPPPKTGWFKKFYNDKNKYKRISQFYVLGGICSFVYIMRYFRNKKEQTQQISAVNSDQEDESVKSTPPPPITGSLKPPFKPEIIIERPGYPTIAINKKEGIVEATFRAPVVGTTHVRAPYSKCLLDENGDLVLDEYGFPVMEDSVYIKFIKKKYAILKTYIESLELFR